MNDVIDIYQHALVIGCAFALAVLALVAIFHVFGRSLHAVRKALSGRELIVFGVLAGVCCWAAQKRLVTFPRTDPTQTYLTDRDSWVDGDLVHVDFSRIIVPDSATMYIDRLEIGAEDARWVPHLIAAFGDIVLPLEFTHENATNYQWIVYTDWTPGPSVQTNGVWHAMWGRDRVRGAYVIPLRTAVRVDGDTIATPKSREDAKDE